MERITDLIDEAMTRGAKERTAFLEEACEGDRDLRQQAERLVKSHEKSGDFLESSAFVVAPELLTDDRGGASVGELIGHYRIESLIGIGGMGEVYLARDERLGRKAALKLLTDSLTTDESQVSRFINDAQSRRVRQVELNVSGTGSRPKGGRAIGHLESWRSNLRDDRGKPAVPRRDAQRLHCLNPNNGATTFIRRIAGCSAQTRIHSAKGFAQKQ